jgi:hypothetical protein
MGPFFNSWAFLSEQTPQLELEGARNPYMTRCRGPQGLEGYPTAESGGTSWSMPSLLPLLQGQIAGVHLKELREWRTTTALVSLRRIRESGVTVTDESAMYPRVKLFAQDALNCRKVKLQVGTHLGRIDVAGLRETRTDFGSSSEVVGVEVKGQRAPFLTAIGQTVAYSVYGRSRNRTHSCATWFSDTNRGKACGATGGFGA